MKIVRVECLPVSTPMKKPVIMPNTRITRIDSVVLKITCDDGTVESPIPATPRRGIAARCRARSSA
ncbi:MAG: hypothetical protein R3E48_03180 [Burkholderiaceae bacterium]